MTRLTEHNWGAWIAAVTGLLLLSKLVARLVARLVSVTKNEVEARWL